MTGLPIKLTFDDGGDPLTFDRLEGVTFAVSKESRTIKGLAVPFGVVGNNGFGRYRFTKGSLDWSKVKYLTHHDWSSAVGNVEFTETDEGLEMTARIARGARGDEVLMLTEDGVYDGLSIGLSANSRFEEDDDGVFECVSATVLEVSGTPIPAFEQAQVRSVAASAAQNKENQMKCTKCGVVHAAGVTECQAPAEGASFSQAQGVQLMEDVQSLTEKIAELEKIKIPVGPGAQLQVAEESIYRFSGSEPAPSGFDFATDLLAAARGSDAALDRLKKFTAEEAKTGPQFVTTGNVDEVNPSTYRPDMFLGQAPTPASPLYDTFHKGSLSNLTPFFWAKLDRVNTNVGVADHTEGTDPTATNLVTATGATVTPIPISGKVHITREVADQGGNPRVSGLIKAEFDRSFAIAREAKTAALVAAAWGSITSLTAAIAAGASGVVAGRAVEAGLVGLQFLADGSRFTKLFGHVGLYTALSQAVIPQFDGDTVGVKAYPIINPQNRDGIQGSKYAFIDLGGYRMEPAASLGATGANVSNSLVADPGAVHVWNSGLTSLDKLQEKVEGWDVGVFAYFAGVVYDVTGLRKIAYDPTV